MLKSQFQALSLEDKAVSSGGSNDRTPVNNTNIHTDIHIGEESHRPIIWKVYSRRKKIGLGSAS